MNECEYVIRSKSKNEYQSYTSKQLARESTLAELKQHNVMNENANENQASQLVSKGNLTNCRPPQLRCLCLAKRRKVMRGREWAMILFVQVKSKNRFQFLTSNVLARRNSNAELKQNGNNVLCQIPRW